MPNLKQNDLRKNTRCCICKKMIGEFKPLPIFWIINAERHGLDIKAVNRQSGFEKMMGNPLIAMHMGTDEDMTNVLCESKAMVCDGCVLERLPELLDENKIINED